MMREFKVDANIGRPQVAYRETIRKAAMKVEGKFIRQSGGRGQYGHVVINLYPGETGSGAGGVTARSRGHRQLPLSGFSRNCARLRLPRT